MTLLYFFYTAATALAPITIAVTPKAELYRYPTYKRVIVVIEKSPDNRWMILAWGSDIGQSGSSWFQLDDKSPVMFDRRVEVTPGHYNFEACLHRIVEGTPKRFCAHQYVEVIGEEDVWEF